MSLFFLSPSNAFFFLFNYRLCISCVLVLKNTYMLFHTEMITSQMDEGNLQINLQENMAYLSFFSMIKIGAVPYALIFKTK